VFDCSAIKLTITVLYGRLLVSSPKLKTKTKMTERLNQPALDPTLTPSVVEVQAQETLNPRALESGPRRDRLGRALARKILSNILQRAPSIESRIDATTGPFIEVGAVPSN